MLKVRKWLTVLAAASAATAVGLSIAPAEASTIPAATTTAKYVPKPLRPFTLDAVKAKNLALDHWEKASNFQSVAADPRSRDMYVVIDHKGRKPSKEFCRSEGDLMITKITVVKNGKTGTSAAAKKGVSACLKGAGGHGQSIGVERYSATGPVYLWIGTAQGVVRAKWPGKDGQNLRPISGLTHASKGAAPFGRNPIPAIDAKNDLIVISSSAAGKYRFTAYRMSAAIKDSWSDKVYDVLVPHHKYTTAANAKGRQTDGLPYQGMTVFGRYIYMLYGAGKGNDPAEARHSFIALERWKINDLGSKALQTATMEQKKAPSNIRLNWNYREPEGLLVVAPLSGSPRLGLGIATRPAPVQASVVELPLS